MRARASDTFRWRFYALCAATAVLVGVLVVVLLSGGDDPDAARQAYARRADAICVAGSRAVARFPARIAAAQRDPDPAAVYRRLAALKAAEAAAAQAELDALGGLTPPADDAEGVKAWVAQRRRRQATVRALGAAFARRDDAAISRLSQRVAALDATTAAFARRYGMRACAR